MTQAPRKALPTPSTVKVTSELPVDWKARADYLEDRITRLERNPIAPKLDWKGRALKAERRGAQFFEDTFDAEQQVARLKDDLGHTRKRWFHWMDRAAEASRHAVRLEEERDKLAARVEKLEAKERAEVTRIWEEWLRGA